ncbi:hypothetical protein LNP24_14945 [Klebsiella pneumoniae subsp. pneumoniae]|nr:hypothetical protein [Klebsiella pneumoniae subsp. pneumoniae]
MEKHLLISKGCKGWGRAADYHARSGEKDCVHHRGIRPPVVDRLSELTGWPSIDVFKNGEPPAEEIGLMVIDCGGTLRCGLYPKREFPPLTCIPPVKAARWRNLYTKGSTSPA